MVVIVTGGAGFIGSHTVECLVSRGYDVVVVDDFSAGSAGNLDRARGSGLRVARLDVADVEQLLRGISALLRPGDVEGVIHLAAMINIVEVMENPQRALDVNVKGTLNVLEFARRFDIERIVFASSVAVYGEPRYLPIDEQHPLDPANLYGETKLMAERLLWRYQRDYGLKPIALRYFNVYGPRMRPGPYAGVIYRFIEALLGGKKPVIYGDGRQTRDFVYVGDVAGANVRALEASYTGPVNIGTGVETSINKLYRILCSIVGYCPEPVYAPPRPGDVRRSRASIKLAGEKLSWRPRISLLNGLRETVKYYLARLAHG